MSLRASMKVYGDDLVMSNLLALPDKMQRKATLRALKPAAAILRKQAKSTVPVGPTGNLKRSIRVRSLKGMPPAVSVHPTYKIAPHKHLIESGTKERTRRRIGGKWAYLEPVADVSRRTTGKVKGVQFFEKAWKVVSKRVSDAVEENLWKIAKESIKHGGEARLPK